MQLKVFEKNLDSEETPLVQSVSTELIAQEVLHKTLYNSHGQKDSSIEVPIFDGTGPTKDLICWLIAVTKYFKLAKVTAATEKVCLVPTFLADSRTVQGLWEDAAKEVFKIQIHPGTQTWTCCGGAVTVHETQRAQTMAATPT